MASSSPRRIAFFAETGVEVQVVLPPAQAEPAPWKNESGKAYAVRAAITKATSLFPAMAGEQAGAFCLQGSIMASANLKREHNHTDKVAAGHEHGSIVEAVARHEHRNNSQKVTCREENLLQYVASFAGIGDACIVDNFTLPVSLQDVIIAADTVVILDDMILGKPDDSAHALAMLRQLRGREHHVTTGCCVLSPVGNIAFSSTTSVTMWDCADHILQRYIATGEPMDKAGAYAIQGVGAFLVQSVKGSWSNVVGLPFAELLQILQYMGCLAAADTME